MLSYRKSTEVAIVGLGGVGGYFGFKLAQHYADAEVRVTFVARGTTYATVRTRGLTLLSPEHSNATAHPARVLDTVAALRDVDLVLLCVKDYDLEAVCAQLNPVLPEQAVLLPLMNGLDVHERIRRWLPQAIILPACVYITSHLQEPAVVEHCGNPGKIIVGNDPQHPLFTPHPSISLLAEAGISIDYQVDAFPAIWAKFIFIASFGLVSARYNKSIREVEEQPALHARAQQLMCEIEAIARAKGIALPTNIVEQTFQKATTFPWHSPTSLQLDVHPGKPRTELALFAGAILAYGAILRIPVPETQQIYQEIKAMMNRY